MKHKRLKFAGAVLLFNFATFWYGINQDADLSALGTGLMMINTPLVGYVLGESYRPSGHKHKDHEKTD